MSMVQAMARVEQIRTEISTFADGTVASAGGPSDRSASSASPTNATDFASVLAAVGAGNGTGSTDVVGSLVSSFSGGAGTSSDDLASLFSSLSSSLAATGGPSSAGSVPPARATPGAGSSVVETAKQYLGVPYVWGGESLAEGGLDCSGLVQLVFGAHGVDLPRVARDQMNQGTEVPSLAQAVPGDLIVQRGGKHIGIYLGDGQMIHSPKPGQTVEISSVTDASVTTIRRVLG